MEKYFGTIADNGKRGLNSWKRSADRHKLKIVSYSESLEDAVILFGDLEDLKRFADEETYAWDSADVKDYVFDTIEEAKHDVEMFVIHELELGLKAIWEDYE